MRLFIALVASAALTMPASAHPRHHTSRSYSAPVIMSSPAIAIDMTESWGTGRYFMVQSLGN